MMSAIKYMFDLICDRRGNIAVTFGLLAPVLVGAVAAGIDFASFNSQKSQLQLTADGAALAAVNEASHSGWNDDAISAVAETYVAANMRFATDLGGLHTVTTTIDAANRQVTVDVSQEHLSYFFESMFPSLQVDVSATATTAGSNNVCVIGLDPNRSKTVGLKDRAELSAPDCAVYSNSLASDGLAARNSSRVGAELACVVGGYRGSASQYTLSQPLTGCAVFDDPLASRPAPAFGGYCDFDELEVEAEGGLVTLYPGVYCDGLSIEEGADVKLMPGIYVIRDGPLTLSEDASMTGDGVGFYFTGEEAAFDLESDSSVHLKAATEGSLAGLLFFQEHDAEETDFILSSSEASMLLGTIYLPNGNFVIDTETKVADASAYTVIVSRTLTLVGEPQVVINTDYDSTPVPVPDGVGPQRPSPRLIR